MQTLEQALPANVFNQVIKYLSHLRNYDVNTNADVPLRRILMRPSTVALRVQRSENVVLYTVVSPRSAISVAVGDTTMQPLVLSGDAFDKAVNLDCTLNTLMVDVDNHFKQLNAEYIANASY